MQPVERRLSSIVQIACILAACSCLAVAYASIGYLPIALAMPALVLFSIVARKSSLFGVASGLLSVYLLLAVAGVVLKAPVLITALGCIAALAAWDLNDLHQDFSSEHAEPAPALGQHRLQALSQATAGSIALAILGTSIRLQLPFGVIVILALLVIGGILYSARTLGK